MAEDMLAPYRCQAIYNRCDGSSNAASVWCYTNSTVVMYSDCKLGGVLFLLFFFI